LKHRTEIDGLRALAIIAVIFFHFFPHFFIRGYLGVDIFFVISGYLITSYFLKIEKLGYFQVLKLFYKRRVKRLFPALFVSLFIISFIAVIIMLRSDLINYFFSLIASMTFWANLYFWQNGDYFGGNEQLKTLLHLWSISVEEQFYIFYPVFLFFLILARVKFKINSFILIFITTIISFIFWIYFNKINASVPAFFLLPTRVWQFGLGAIVFFLHFDKNLPDKYFKYFKYRLIFIFSLILLFTGFALSTSQILSTIIICLGTSLFIFSRIDKNTPFAYLFTNTISVWIGKISYSLYLYHWPVVVFLLYVFVNRPPYYFSLIGIFFSLILATISYLLIEKPYRYKYSLKSTIFVTLVTGCSSIIIVLLAIKFSGDSLESKWANAAQTNLKCSPLQYVYFGSHKSRSCKFNNYIKKDIKFILLGNSHAQMYRPLLKDILEKKKISGISVTLQGCLPTVKVNISTECTILAKENLSAIINTNSVEVVIIASTWYNSNYLGSYGIQANQEELITAFVELIDILEKSGKIVVLVSPIEIPGKELATELPRLVKFNHITLYDAKKMLSVDRSIYEVKFNYLNNFFEKKLGNKYIKVYEDLCDKNKCFFGINDQIFFKDGNHLSNEGLRKLTKTEKQIEAILNRK
jgi:peptidoglycan/LPS O-acetylase OafA/YrhL